MARQNHFPFDSLEDFIENGSALAGSAEQVTEKLLDLHRLFGNQVLGVGVEGFFFACRRRSAGAGPGIRVGIRRPCTAAVSTDQRAAVVNTRSSPSDVSHTPATAPTAGMAAMTASSKVRAVARSSMAVAIRSRSRWRWGSSSAARMP
ncbi:MULTISPECIES: hypothetical protein [unclassified Frankia]